MQTTIATMWNTSGTIRCERVSCCGPRIFPTLPQGCAMRSIRPPGLAGVPSKPHRLIDRAERVSPALKRGIFHLPLLPRGFESLAPPTRSRGLPPGALCAREGGTLRGSSARRLIPDQGGPSFPVVVVASDSDKLGAPLSRGLRGWDHVNLDQP